MHRLRDRCFSILSPRFRACTANEHYPKHPLFLLDKLGIQGQVVVPVAPARFGFKPRLGCQLRLSPLLLREAPTREGPWWVALDSPGLLSLVPAKEVEVSSHKKVVWQIQTHPQHWGKPCRCEQRLGLGISNARTQESPHAKGNLELNMNRASALKQSLHLGLHEPPSMLKHETAP